MKNVYLFVYFILIQTLANAQWVSMEGPYGGYVYQLKANDTYVFAAKQSGIYRSNDGGQIWKKSDSTNRFGRIALDGKSLLANYNINNLSHLRFSPDNGDHWENVPVPNGTPFLENYAIKGNIILLSTLNLIMRSDDLGQNWESYAIAGEPFQDFKLLGTFEGRTYLGNRTRLFSSEDGLSWTFLANVPGNSQNDIQKLFKKGDVMIALVGKTISRSLDAGLQWEIGATEDNNNLTVNTEFSSENGVFYASTGKPMFHSIDNGLSWTYIDPNGPKIYYHTSQNNRIFGHLFGLGVLRSTNFGQSFETSNYGLDGGDVMTLSVQNNDLWLWDEQGITKQNTNQLNWDAPYIYPLPTLFGSYVNIFHFKNAVFVRRDHGELLRSFDNGQSWTTVTPDPSIVSSDFITFNQKGDSLFLSSESFDTYLSTDFGENWTAINPNINSQIGGTMKALTIQGPNAFVSDKINVYRSNNNLQTCSKVGNNSPLGTGLLHLKLYSTPRFLFAFVNREEVFRSADAGETWLPISIPFPNPFNISSEHEVVFAEFGAVLVAFFEQGGIFASYNDGISWELFTEGIPFETSVTTFGYNETSLWAGTYYFGVYQRAVSDLTSLSAAQPNSSKNTLKISPNPSQGTFSCTFPFEISGEATLCVFDLQGKKIRCRNESAAQLKNVDLSNLASGIYVVSIATTQGVFVGKVVLRD